MLVLPSVLLCQCECYLLRYSVSVSIYLLCIMSVLVFTFCVIMSVLELPYVLLVPAGSPSRAGGVVGFFQRHKPTELTHSFLFCCCVCFYLLTLLTVFHRRNFPDNSPHSHSALPVYFGRIGPFNYISLYERLLQP